MVLPIARPAVRYHGGKWLLAPWIISHFPAHECYVEPFGGGASVLLRKEPSPVEIYNDLDSEAVNFFRVLRDQPECLIRAVGLTPYSREEQRGAYDTDAASDLERARRFFVAAWQSFGASIHRKSGWRYMRTRRGRGNTPADDWDTEDRLEAIARRLRRVGLENGRAETIMARFDAPETLFYVDPPYTLAERTARQRAVYAFEMDDAAHRSLARTLNGLSGAVVLSGYRSDLYDALYEGWERHERSALANSIGVNKRRTVECLWVKIPATPSSTVPVNDVPTAERSRAADAGDPVSTPVPAERSE